MTNKRKQIKEEKQNSENFESKITKQGILSSSAKKKKRTFRPFKDPVETMISSSPISPKRWAEACQKPVPEGTDVVMTEAPAVEECSTQNSTSCETLSSTFSPMTSANTWELLQLRKLMEDPFLSCSRKQFMQNRILELNETIIKDILSQADNSDQNEFFVLERLHSMANDDNLQIEQKQQAECILVALKDKVISDVLKDASDIDADYDQTVDKLQALLRITWIPQEEKGWFIEKVAELKGKLASGLAKQTHVPVDEGIRLLEKFRHLMKDPFLCGNSKSKLLRKVSYLRNTTISSVLKSDNLDQCELINTLNQMLQDPYLPYHKRLTVVNKIKGVEDRASKELKRCKLELKEKLLSSMSEVLGFEGTNLDFISGYGIQNPQYVRCIHIWNPKPCDV